MVFSLGVFGLNIVAGVFRWIPTALAVCGLVSLYAYLQIDSIVNVTLYRYGLQFSYDWATPYWTLGWVVMAMSGIIFGLAISTQAYLLLRSSPSKGGKAEPGRVGEENGWSVYKLSDGSTIKVKMTLTGATRLDKYSDDGLPIYTVKVEPIVQVVHVPEELKASNRH
jgi:hypothetical protein